MTLKRQKELQICDLQLEAISKKSFEIDQRSHGKEGGRIVQNLLADLAESPLQAAIGRSPNDCRASGPVQVSYMPPDEVMTAVARKETLATADSPGPKSADVHVRFSRMTSANAEMSAF